ncbi:MAG: lipocalin-like domain-containing protein [Acidobacteriota bacterium]
MLRRRVVGSGRLALVAGVVALVALAGRPGLAQGTLRARIIGQWRLISSEQIFDGAAPVFSQGPSPSGMLTYTADGHMQGQLGSTIRPKVRRAEATVEQQRELLRTYTAYFGTFDVDERAGTVTHHRDGTLAPGERDYVRTVVLSGNRLTLITPTTVVDGKKRFLRTTWERLDPAAPAASYAAAARKAVVGTWELVEHKTTMATGEVRRNFGASPKGLFIFTEDGHTAVQIVNPERPATTLAKATDDEVRELSRSYLAYFGSFDVDEATRKIVVHTTNDLNPINSGTDQIRFFELTGDVLVLQPAPAALPGGDQQVSRITWHRVK